MKPPARIYTSSNRTFPQHVREPQYSEGFSVRRCDDAGKASIHGVVINLSTLLHRAELGIREYEDGQYEIFYGPVPLGYLDKTVAVPRFRRA